MANYSGCKVRPFADSAGRCDRCGTRLIGRQGRWCSNTCTNADLADHYWTMARKVRLVRDKRTCRHCGEPAVEVNHRIPRRGAGYGTGCWNHQSGLESLCRACHQKVTNAQRAAAKAARAYLLEPR